MSGETFELKPRREDLEEIFAERSTFKLFSQENSTRLFYLGFFLIGVVASIYNIFKYPDQRLPILICGLGTLYNSWCILKVYLDKQKVKRSVSIWINGFIHFKNHRITLHERGFMYFRDHYEYLYDFSKIEQYVKEVNYVAVTTSDELRILLPKKALTTGDFQKFITHLDELSMRLNSSKLVNTETEGQSQ